MRYEAYVRFARINIRAPERKKPAQGDLSGRNRRLTGETQVQCYLFALVFQVFCYYFVDLFLKLYQQVRGNEEGSSHTQQNEFL